MGMQQVFLGIDLGTTGLRAILSNEKGEILSSKSQAVEESFVQNQDEHFSEQNPRGWESALFSVLDDVFKELGENELKAVCVDSTSGTIIPVDKRGNPLYNAILHNDIRSYREAEFINSKTSIIVKPSFALPKILWIKNNMPHLFENTFKFIHAADYVRGLISGDYSSTDFSNSVKTGYDLLNYRWPEEIESVLGIPIQKLPHVFPTGESVGELRKELSERYNIRNKVVVVAGATDSTTSFYSSGATQVGDWNTTLGTVLGIRGVAEQFIQDPEGLLYTHRHPEGFWLPGAASNTGGESLRLFFGNHLKEYDKKIEGLPPTDSFIYPLVRKSEKFPFSNINAQGFIILNGLNPVTMFKGFLEGITYIEKMIYERIKQIGYKVGQRIFSMGGGAYSLPWMRIRASVLNRAIYRAKIVETAFGAAIISASGTYYENLTGAIEGMVSMDCMVEPELELIQVYEEKYNLFVEECKKRNLF